MDHPKNPWLDPPMDGVCLNLYDVRRGVYMSPQNDATFEILRVLYLLYHPLEEITSGSELS